MKRLIVLFLVVTLLMTSCLTDTSISSRSEIQEFEEESQIDTNAVMVVLTWGSTPYAKEISKGLMKGTITLKYDEEFPGTVGFEDSGDTLCITFGDTPYEIDKSNGWIYGAGLIIAAYHIYKDGTGIEYGFETMEKILTDPGMVGMPFPSLYKDAINALVEGPEAFDEFAAEHIIIEGNIIRIE